MLNGVDIELVDGSNWDLKIPQELNHVSQGVAPLYPMRLEINSDWSDAKMSDIPEETHLVVHSTNVELSDCAASEIEMYGESLSLFMEKLDRSLHTTHRGSSYSKSPSWNVSTFSRVRNF
jgi:hypothetical protein